MPKHKLHERMAFTLIEVLVVVGVIALLIAILVPSLARSREQARSVVCQSNLKQWGNAILMYAQAFTDTLPFEERPDPNVPGQDDDQDRVWDNMPDAEGGAICWFDSLDRYLSMAKADEDVKTCPTVRRADPYREESYRMNSKLAEVNQENDYYRPYRKLSTLDRPLQTVLLFDGDIGAGTALGSAPSFKGRWRANLNPGDYKDDVNYRHNRTTNLLFTGWHVENVQKKVLFNKSLQNEPIVWQPADMGEWDPSPP